ncbi:MAG: hypothetical protein ACREBF_02855 [Candidatus Micrarchaeales archaeon]
MSYKFSVEGVNRLGVRASKTTVGGIQTEFPQRIETNTDRYYLDRLPDDISLPTPPSDIFMVKRSYTQEQLIKLVASESYYNSEKKKIEGIRTKRQNCISVFNLSVGKNTKISDRANLRLLGLQVGFSVQRIFDSYDLTPNELLERIKVSVKYIREHGINEHSDALTVSTILQQLPTVFHEKYQIIMKETDGSAVKYTTPYSVRRQLRIIEQFVEGDKWQDLYDVPKTWGGNSRTSMMHIMAKYGFDTFSLRTGKRPKNLTRKPILKRFDENSLGYLIMPHEHERRYNDNLMCSCYVCRGQTLADFRDNYTPDEQSKVYRGHEPYASNMEFAMDRTLALESGNELLNRYKRKEFARQPFKEVLGIDFANARL